jgi:CAP12/Pycsar effector protein, TIR domain
MNDLPRVFIASSKEGLKFADAVNIKLEYVARVKQWDNAFDPSSITITSLIKRAKDADYGIFVFHNDDEIIIRKNSYSVVRDNVLLELGLFIGALGLEKCFVLIPKSTKDEFRMPTDLDGVTTSTYDDQEEDPVDAVATSCAKIKFAIEKLQKLNEPTNTPKNQTQEIIQKQLNSAQSDLWRIRNEVERSKEEHNKLLTSIINFFHSIAKPATAVEITLWEKGAENNYPDKPKINTFNVFYVDKDVVVPELHGASSISVIVAEGVTVYGIEQRGHNSVYYMDGFRKLGF